MWLLPDYICDGVYILDVVVRLHTGTGMFCYRKVSNSSIWFSFALLVSSRMIRILRTRFDGERLQAPETKICRNVTV